MYYDSLRPWNFKGVSYLSEKITMLKKSWMTKISFKHWLPKLDKFIKEEVCKIVGFIDNYADTHPVNKNN